MESKENKTFSQLGHYNRKLVEHLRMLNSKGVDHKELSVMLLQYYEVASPKIKDLLAKHSEHIVPHVSDVLDRGIDLHLKGGEVSAIDVTRVRHVLYKLVT